MFEKTGKTVRLLSFKEDQPSEEIGSLIPRSVRELERNRSATSLKRAASLLGKGVVSAVAVALFVLLGVSGYSFVGSLNQVATPTVTIVDPHTFNKVSLGYGPQAALAQENFFSEARDAFVEESLTFIEVDLDAKLLRFFENGVLVQSAEILAVGENGSWWDAPSGLYKVEKTEESEFSTVVQAYFPWTITFEGNYTIHGWPQYPDDSAVPESFVGGGIRLADEDAKELFARVSLNLPILVHQKPEKVDAFIYEPTVPDITAPHYLIADIDNASILAASDLEDAVPIASLTKLMTAVVTAEKMDLDSRVQVTSPTFVESLIPRLADRSSVSMYSLLQLLLVESSNEAAEVIAGEYGKEAFVGEMNTKATQIGMQNSTFADPSGLSADNVSSLKDLFLLSQYIHKNRGFIFEITANEKLPTINGLNEFNDLMNFNEVENVDNFVGGKVGETAAAGKTSVSLHKVKIQGQERMVIIILLGSSERTKDVQSLLRFVEERFKS